MRQAMRLKTILPAIAVVVVSFFVSLKTMDWLWPRDTVRAPVLVELPPLPPALVLGRRGRPDGGDGIQVGLVNGAPDLGQIGRQRGQIREISPAGLAHPAGTRTGQSVEPFRLERLPADTAKSRFHGHM